MMQRHAIALFISIATFTTWCISISVVNTAEAKGRNKPPPSEFVPMAVDYENYFFRIAHENSCLGEDDELEWDASGSLAPGESFSFSPGVGACNGHPAAISVVASWRNGTLNLTSTVPDADYSSWDPEQYGHFVEAPVVDNMAQLCMFPRFSIEGESYTITLTNNSSEVVNDITLHGKHENDWSIFYYPRCLNADADDDGWNDSLEHTMANLVYPNGYIDGVLQPDILWGSNYLRGTAITSVTNDEIDSYPPDFNDDGRVDELDLGIIETKVGVGNGIPLENISPNSGENGYHDNTLPWRRYDLDADGYVDGTDRGIVLQLMNQDGPMLIDIVVPTARVTEPSDGGEVARGESVMIRGHVWDNAALSRVEYLVNGKTVCSVSDPSPSFGFTSPYYYCWWNVPKRSTDYEVQIRVHDAAGNIGTSQLVSVQAR